jgi:hypothetical protein
VNLDEVDYEGTGSLAGTGAEAEPALADFRFLVVVDIISFSEKQNRDSKRNLGQKVFINKLSPKHIKNMDKVLLI